MPGRFILQFCWRNVSAVLVEPSVIEPIDPFGGGILDLLDGPPRAPVFDQLGLVQTVDRLGERIIERIPNAANRSRDASLGQVLREPHRSILPAGVGVMNHPAQIGDAVAAPGPDRVLDGIQDQLRGHRGRGAPAKDAPGVRVGDERDVDPSRPRRHIGYVGDPQHVRREGAEPAPH
jgi:hypothetical protein